MEGWKRIDLEASDRWDATVSAMMCRASARESRSRAATVVRGGMLASESGDEEEACAGGHGSGAVREPVDDVMLMGRRESGVLVREGGVESSSMVRLERRVVRKAVWRVLLVVGVWWIGG